MNLCDIEELHHVEVTKEDEVTRRVNLHLKDPDKEVNISIIIIYIICRFIFVFSLKCKGTELLQQSSIF